VHSKSHIFPSFPSLPVLPLLAGWIVLPTSTSDMAAAPPVAQPAHPASARLPGGPVRPWAYSNTHWHKQKPSFLMITVRTNSQQRRITVKSQVHVVWFSSHPTCPTWAHAIFDFSSTFYRSQLTPWRDLPQPLNIVRTNEMKLKQKPKQNSFKTVSNKCGNCFNAVLFQTKKRSGRETFYLS